MVLIEIGCKGKAKKRNNKHFINFFIEKLSFCYFVDTIIDLCQEIVLLTFIHTYLYYRHNGRLLGEK